MSGQRTPLTALVDHMEWADRRLWQAVAAVDDALWDRPLPASFGSLAGTTEHLFACEWTWLERIQGRAPEQVGPPGRARGRERLAALWPAVWAGWQRVAATEDLGRVVPYRTTAGVPQATPLLWIGLHVTQHSATYRGQVAAVLRQLGLTPPATDLILWQRQQGPGTSPPPTAS